MTDGREDLQTVKMLEESLERWKKAKVTPRDIFSGIFDPIDNAPQAQQAVEHALPTNTPGPTAREILEQDRNRLETKVWSQ